MAVAVITYEPLVVLDAVIQFGNNDHSATVTSVKLTPSVTNIRHRGLAKTSVKNRAVAVWAVDIAADVDLETTNSLAQYLITNRDTEVAMTIKPRSGTGPSFTATALIPAYPLDFTAEQLSSTSFSMPCTEPVLVP